MRPGILVPCAALLLAGALWSRPEAGAEPAHGFSATVERALDCPGGCAGVIYVWSPLLPLSREGVAEIRAATEALDLDLVILGEPEISAWAAARFTGRASPPPKGLSRRDSLADAMVAAGVTVHAPAVLPYRNGELLGPAILGYKGQDAYWAMLRDRLRGALQGRGSGAAQAPSPSSDRRAAAAGQALNLQDAPQVGSSWKDVPARGAPGAYFRWAPGRDAIAFEAGQVVYLLRLSDGQTSAGPGFIDFVPAPDGRFFVTPASARGGLAFYDAEQVFLAAARGMGRDVPPFWVDPGMRDQYPSVGVVGQGEATGSLVYRVLTSWYDGAIFRDYEVTGAPGGALTVRALGEPTAACRNLRISIPILAPGGRELAARDEATGSTRIFRLQDDGRCQVDVDLGRQTGKVAWEPGGRRVAFAIPPGTVRDGAGVLWRGADAPEQWGIFVFDRASGATSRLRGSEEARRTTFPEFVGHDRIIFLMAPATRGATSHFRVVCCLR